MGDKQIGQLIKIEGQIEEGATFNKFLESRMIRHNQNCLIGITGPTGSGKSYISLRVGELWYKHQFNSEFLISHVCFSIEEVMRLLNSKTLRRGDLIILEEGGVNLGSLDFQNKISKMFTYVLQSFRSMNLCLIINLPVLSMLNKSARLLLHANFITSGINHQKKICKIKPFFHQLNQQSGKVYPKYLRVKHNGILRTVKRFNYSLPNSKLIEAYENSKFRFVSELNESFVAKIESDRRKEDLKLQRKTLTPLQKQTLELRNQGLLQREIAEIQGRSQYIVCKTLQAVENHGYKIYINENKQKSLQKSKNNNINEEKTQF